MPVQPCFGLGAIFLGASGDDVPDRALRNEQRLGVRQKLGISWAVIVLGLRVVAAENAVEVEAPSRQADMLRPVPCEQARAVDRLEPKSEEHTSELQSLMSN